MSSSAPGDGPGRSGGVQRDAIPRILLVTSWYSGLREFVVGTAAMPTGMPAVSELWLGLTRAGVQFDHLQFAPAGSAVGARQEVQRPDLSGRFLVQPVPALRNLPATLVRLQHLLRQVWKGGYGLLYADRAHVVEAAVVARYSKLPVVLRLHGVAGLPATLARRGWNPARHARHWALRAPFAHVLASEDGSPVASFLKQHLDPAVPRSVWLNGVPDRGKSAPSPAPRCPVVLFAGRLDEGKGAQRFVAAMRELGRIRTDVVAQIAGDGPLQDTIRKECRGLPNVQLLGAVPHSRMDELYRSASVYVSLNELGNLNNTVLEALNAGCCIVTLGACPATGRDESSERLLGQAVHFVPREITAPNLARELAVLLASAERRDDYRSRARQAGARLLRPWSERIDREVSLLLTLAATEARNGAAGEAVVP